MRRSRFAVGLVSLADHVLLELSPAAVTLTGLRTSDRAPVDLGVIAAEHELVVSLRVVARDADQPYAIALFSSLGNEEPSDATPTIETLLGPLRDLGDPDWSNARRSEDAAHVRGARARGPHRPPARDPDPSARR